MSDIAATTASTFLGSFLDAYAAEARRLDAG